MKIWSNLLFAGFILGLTPTAAHAGKESGGGIILSAEFATAGRQAIAILSGGDSKLNLSSILSAIKDTKVIPVDSICYTDPVLQKQYCEDAHYDAKNNVVLFSYQKWDDFGCKEKIVLSAHEFLRAAGLETEDYTFSGRFISGRIAQCEGSGGSAKQQQACADLSMVLVNKFSWLCGDLTELTQNRKR